MGETKRKEEEAVVARLKLLDKMMKLHEWSVFEQNDSAELEEADAEIDSEDTGPTNG